MSDMIDRLSRLSREVGDAAARSLADPATVQVMEHSVRRTLRRKRIVTAVASVAALAVVGGGGLVAAPLLNQAAPGLEPASTPQVVHSDGVVTVYDNGATEVVTSQGRVVAIEAPDPASFVPFAVPSTATVCASAESGDFGTGWTYHTPAARELLGNARVYGSAGDRTELIAAAGSTLVLDDGDRGTTSIAFDVDPAILDYIALRSTAVVVNYAGAMSYQTLLDAQPTTHLEGSGAQRVGVVSSPVTDVHLYCPGEAHKAPGVTSVVRYLTVDVYLNDGSGHVTRLATHRSWAAVEFTS